MEEAMPADDAWPTVLGTGQVLAVKAILRLFVAQGVISNGMAATLMRGLAATLRETAETEAQRRAAEMIAGNYELAARETFGDAHGRWS
jgi:hypothetical protein